jgi:hypothetical protein
MNLFIRLSFATLLAIPAIAQSTSSASGPAIRTGGVLGAVIAPSGVVSGGPGWTFSSVGPGMQGGAVTGAPYSAEQITEHIQTLADGTHIIQPAQTTKFYRDSQGRTRTERTAPLPPGPLANVIEVPVFVDIADPVAGVRYSLEPDNHTAHKMSMPSAPPPPPPPPSANNAPAAARMIHLLPALSPSVPPSQQDQASRPQFSHESLGTQTIEGVLAEGSRTTVTYPIGAIGNDRPITTTTETWNSPGLKTVVLSKNSDPRNGESTTRLINISRAEPDPSLFRIPANYEIIEP